MNKKCTLLATAFLMVGTCMASAAGAVVPAEQWTTGNFYYLASGDNYLSLDGSKADSVVVKTFAANPTKASIDSALWQISDKATSLGVTTYKFTNKATKQLLSFASKANADLNLAAGVDQWVFEGGIFKGYYSGAKFISLAVADNKLALSVTAGSAFTVEAPDAAFPLDAKQLGNGFQVFQLNFGDTYEGNIFVGELLAKDVMGKAEYVTLQSKADESYADGKAKYFGVDTLKTTISGAKDVFGYKFALDSTRTTVKPNATYQQFKFTVDLKNDSLAMFVAAAPSSTANEDIQVVYASVDTKKVLTVSKVKADGSVEQGAAPYITLSTGTPATIPTGTGVYFLKSASKTASAGKYIVAKNGGDLAFMGGDSVPSLNLSRGQWYIKETNGKYSVVDRQSNTALIINQEVFAVQGMANTYVFGADSVTVSNQQVNLNNVYLGSLYFTENELASNGYVLNLIPGTAGVNNLYAYATDSILKGKIGDAKDAAIFKLIPADTTLVGGAQQLGDKLSVISYKLRGLFNSDTIAKQTDSLKFSKFTLAQSFRFISDATAEKYAMLASDGKYVGMNINTSCVQLSANAAYVTLQAIDAPEYATFASSHKQLTSDAKSLVMNPLNFFAEMKSEGQGILKADYAADNFSLWVEQAAVVAGKQLYFISSGLITTKAAADTRYYLVSARDSAKDANNNIRALFVQNDTIKTMKDSPALFAFKTAEDGGYYLENQKELNSTAADKAPYVGNVNGFAVMQKEPVALFTVDQAAIPTNNEEISTTEIKVLSSNGEVIVTNASGRKVMLSNILGQTIGTRRASSDYFTVPASAGIVLVTIEGDTTHKVIVK